MNLIKSKINSLAWLNPAMYVSVVGGVILSSTPVLAATLTPTDDRPTYFRFVVTEDTFRTGVLPPLIYNGLNWRTTVNITQSDRSASDDLVVRVYLQHNFFGEPGAGGALNLDFRSTSSSANPQEYDRDSSRHIGRGSSHYDEALGILTVNKFRSSDGNTGIRNWNLVVTGETQSVPEPSTILSTSVALGWGGWLKRKNLIKQNKTKSQA
jgi:hypothetical protein